MKSEQKKYPLSAIDHQRLKSLLGREPKTLERVLAVALWNEHCSYRSSKKHLKKFLFLTKKKVSGLGEQAGIVDLGQGEKICFKMESHNHPSYITPYHGAGTAVGGILRDIFAMNARPMALADYLCFPDKAKNTQEKKEQDYRVSEVVRGIGDYGNCIGVPTVTGYTEFSENYRGNILVNSMALGYLDSKSQVMNSKAQGIGNYVVYVGAATGRDGILGADMASQSFKEDKEDKKTTVQIGDPFFGKQLMEGCLEAMRQGWVIACQDMGAAGLTCSSFEMSDKAGLGLSLHLDRVPLRDKSMQPEDILLSESQERMLFVCQPSFYKKIKKLFQSYGLEVSHLGEVLPSKEIVLYWKGQEILKVDPKLFTSNSPLEDRSFIKPEPALRVPKEQLTNDPKHSETGLLGPSHSSLSQQGKLKKEEGHGLVPYSSLSQQRKYLDSKSIKTELLKQLSSPQGRSRQFIFRQYDQRVGTKTIKDSSYPIAILRLPETGRLLGLAMGCRPYLMKQDVEQGAKDAIFYPALKLALRGFSPLAVTDCLNFGNPEKKEIMGQFVLAVESIAKACKVLDSPIISGNVSFYNESGDKNIIPTPSIVMAGLQEKACKLSDSVFVKEGESVYLLHSHGFIFEGMRAIYKDQGGSYKNQNTKSNPTKKTAQQNMQNTLTNTITQQNIQKSVPIKQDIKREQEKPYLAYGALQDPLVKLFIDQILELSRKNYFSTADVVGKFGLAYHLSRMVLGQGMGFSLSESFPYPLFQERLYEVIVCVPKDKEEELKQDLKRLYVSYKFMGTTQDIKALRINKDCFLPVKQLRDNYHRSWKDLSL